MNSTSSHKFDNELGVIMEELMYYYVTTPYHELKNIFRNVVTLLYKYFTFHEIDQNLLKMIRDFIEYKKRQPLQALDQ